MDEHNDEQNSVNPADYGTPLHTLRDYLAICFRRRRLVLFAFLGIFVVSALFALDELLDHQYQAEIKFLVKKERIDPMLTPESNLQQRITDLTEEELNSEVQLMDSHDMLEKVVETWGLAQPPFWYHLIPEGWINLDRAVIKANAVRQLDTKLVIQPQVKTNLIAVTYQSSDPYLAARALRTLADLYMKKHLTIHRAPGTSDFFREETNRYLKGLNLMEARLTDFDQKEGLVSVQLEKENTLRKLAEFEATAQLTQASIAETKERIRSLENQAASTPPRLTSQVRTTSVLVQQLKSTLLTLELKRTDLLQKFEPTYRPVQEIETQITQTRATLAEAEKAPPQEETIDRNPTYDWIKSELAKAKSELAGLQARGAATGHSIGVYRANARRLDQNGIIQQGLLRSAKATEENYLLYLRKQEEARISDRLDQHRFVNVAIAEPVTVPVLEMDPYAPVIFLVLGAILGCLVSVGLAFAADYLYPSFHTPRELEAALNVPVLAAVPQNGK